MDIVNVYPSDVRARSDHFLENANSPPRVFVLCWSVITHDCTETVTCSRGKLLKEIATILKSFNIIPGV
jgi:hypothetical protein